MPEGKKNVYLCRVCGWKRITIDVDEGVTPMFIKCRCCEKLATSSMHDVDQTLEPTHEWYSPGGAERKRMAKTVRGLSTLRHHVEHGGLLQREIVKERKAPA
jgi:hypothetical protein